VDAIRCCGLGRRYGSFVALEALDMTVPAGIVFGFLGKNGAGKTTTIRILTGLTRPSTGSGWVDGVETTSGSGAGRDRFGYLPEEPAFYPWMTPREYLDHIGRLFRMPREARARRAGELLEQVGLESAAERRITGFSRGMRQRLGLAQALMHEPRVLFLDEPASALDPAGRRDVLKLIEHLRGRVTIFFSSHLLTDVERVCDRIAVLHESRLLVEANKSDLLAQHATDVFVLELDAGSQPPEAFLSTLAQTPWVKKVSRDGAALRVRVSDVAEATRALLPLALSQGLVLSRYERIGPSLEDVFLSLSADEATDA
jgi:ABC-2 type transport system ATP-binding protein